MYKFISFVFFLNFSLTFAQKAYQFPEYFNPSYDLKPQEAHKALMLQKNPNVSKLDFEKYIAIMVYGEQYIFDNNDIYLDWVDVEKYLRNITKAVLPKNELNKNINVLIGRSHHNNANTTRFGNLVYNIGKLDYNESETFLAYDLAYESSHYLFKHMLKDNADASNAQADSFATAVLLENKLIRDTLFKVVLKKEDFSKTLKKGVKYGDTVNQKSYLINKKFFFDSLFFKKLKKVANEERKKIAFEECDYNSCLELAFVDYLVDRRSIKNLYYLIESTRRLMYSKCELRKTGFLTEKNYNAYNKSILFEPDNIFRSRNQYEQLKSHDFFISDKKPFNTYEEAFAFFIEQALKLNFNEANFSLALDLYALNKIDSSKKYLNDYLRNGNGLYSDMAKSMIDKNRPYLENGRTFILYNNVEHLSEGQFNYFLSKKRKEYNQEFKNEIGNDTTKYAVLIVNELLGNNPKKLNQTQKMMNSVFSLFNEEDREMCKKITRNSHYATEDNVLASKYKKNFIIYAPEWYAWYKENKCDKLFFVNVTYHCNYFLTDYEYYNFYTGYFLDINSDRPYFRDPTRKGFIKKHTEKDIRKDILTFLND